MKEIMNERKNSKTYHWVIVSVFDDSDDSYGFPVARLIHSPYTADMIYFMMKPLEWIFLIVLYFCDVNPENRIAMQYLPRQE